LSKQFAATSLAEFIQVTTSASQDVTVAVTAHVLDVSHFNHLSNAQLLAKNVPKQTSNSNTTDIRKHINILNHHKISHELPELLAFINKLKPLKPPCCKNCWETDAKETQNTMYTTENMHLVPSEAPPRM